MKSCRSILALMLAALMLLLCGCSAFGTKLAQAIEKMSRKDDLHFSLTAELELSVARKGGEEALSSITLPGRFEAEGDLFTDPLQSRFDASLTLPGAQSRWECYVEKDEGAYYLYSRLNDGTLWQKQGLADDGKARVKGLKYIVKGTESFAPAEGEQSGDGSAARYDGLISGEYLTGLLELYRVREWLCEELGLTLSEGLFDALADVPASVWLDRESGMIVRLDAELGALVSQLCARELAAGREASSFDTLGLALSVERAHVTLRLSGFDEAEAFKIPDEAKAAWGGDVMPWE